MMRARNAMRRARSLLTPSEADAIYRQLLRVMGPEEPAGLSAVHAKHLSEHYGLSGTVLGEEYLCTWQPERVAATGIADDARLPKMPRPHVLLKPNADALFIPALDWSQRIVGATVKTFGPRAERWPYLTFGDHFTLKPVGPVSGGMVGDKGRRGGYASLRIREPSTASHALAASELIEPPLHVARPVATKEQATSSERWVGLCEGVLKSMSVAQAFGVPVIAEWSCGHGQFFRSPTQLRSLLQQAAAAATGVCGSGNGDDGGSTGGGGSGGGDLPSTGPPTAGMKIVFLADAGAVGNPRAALAYIKTLQLLADWGETVHVGWWGQTAKLADGGPGDVDEHLMARGWSGGGGAEPPAVLSDVMSLISPAEFERQLVGEAADAVGRWRRETEFVSMAETVEWDAMRVDTREDTPKAVDLT